MASSISDFAAFRFSTDALPERDRLAIWRDVLARNVVKLDMAPLNDAPFRVEAVMRALPGLGIAAGSYSPVRVERTRALADGGDDVVLQLSTTPTIASQSGREVEVGAGDALAMATAEVSALVAPSGSRFLALRLHRKRLAPLVQDLDAAILRPVPGGAPALRLLTGYVKALGDENALLTAELRELVVVHVYDLAALALGASREGAALAAGRGVAAARLQAIKADILMNLDGPDLTADAMAARHRITSRYVRQLFRADGTTFGDFVLEQRLLRAYRMLIEPRFAARHIGDVAFACGFGDLSYFNRSFRHRFGDTPSGVRAGMADAVSGMGRLGG